MASPAITKSNTLWQPGQSGNPSGRPKNRRVPSKLFLRKIRHQEEWVALYREAKKEKDYRCCVEILKFHHEQAFGKAYVADNPELSARAQNIYNDKVLQQAINVFLPQDPLIEAPSEGEEQAQAESAVLALGPGEEKANDSGTDAGGHRS